MSSIRSCGGCCCCRRCNYSCNEKYGNISTNIMLVVLVYFIRIARAPNICRVVQLSIAIDSANDDAWFARSVHFQTVVEKEKEENRIKMHAQNASRAERNVTLFAIHPQSTYMHISVITRLLIFDVVNLKWLFFFLLRIIIIRCAAERWRAGQQAHAVPCNKCNGCRFGRAAAFVAVVAYLCNERSKTRSI